MHAHLNTFIVSQLKTTLLHRVPVVTIIILSTFKSLKEILYLEESLSKPLGLLMSGVVQRAMIHKPLKWFRWLVGKALDLCQFIAP